MPDTPVGTNSPDYGPLTSADLAASIYCKVTATNASGTANADSNTVGPVTAGSGGWTPASLTGLIAWYKADTGVYSDAGTTPAAADALVVQWNDQSGGGRHLVNLAPTNGAYKPTGFNSTHPCFFNDYSGGGDLQTAADTLPQGGTGNLSVWIVARADVGITDNNKLLSYAGVGLDPSTAYADTGSAVALVYGATGPVIGGQHASGVLATAPITLGTNYRFGSVFDGVDHKIYVNNVAIGSAVAKTSLFTSPGRLSLGIAGDTWMGAVAEIVVTNTVLSSGDRTSLDNYFKAKWGLT